jgi:hypothetical protein
VVTIGEWSRIEGEDLGAVPPGVAGWRQGPELRFPGNPPLTISSYRRLDPSRYGFTSSSVTTSGRPAHAVAPDRVEGFVDGVRARDGAVSITGWASRIGGGPVDAVVAFSAHTAIAAGVPRDPRPDVARSKGIDPANLGFTLLAHAAVVGRGRRLRVFGIAGGSAAALEVTCNAETRRLIRC